MQEEDKSIKFIYIKNLVLLMFNIVYTKPYYNKTIESQYATITEKINFEVEVLDKEAINVTFFFLLTCKIWKKWTYLILECKCPHKF